MSLAATGLVAPVGGDEAEETSDEEVLYDGEMAPDYHE